MNLLLEQRRQALPHYVRQLTPEDLQLPFQPMEIACDALLHGDHNLVVKLRIRSADGACVLRCLRIDGSETSRYKQQEYACLTWLNGKAIGPQVFSWKVHPPMLIREWVEPMTPLAEFYKGRRDGFLRECAALYQRLHSIDMTPHLSPDEIRHTPESRYRDFISVLTKTAGEHPDRLEHWKTAFLHKLAGQSPRDLPQQGAPSMTQLSPKDGNLIVYQGSPFFIDWDTVRCTDKERDIAVFIGVYIETPEEACALLQYLPSYDRRLIGRYVLPVMLWQELRGRDRLSVSRFQCLQAIADTFLKERR